MPVRSPANSIVRARIPRASGSSPSAPTPRASRTCLSDVSAVALPKDDEEAAKFVRGAMLAFPELYFARFVILGEGDSERVVLPRLAKAEGLLIDPAFVAIVPLGGRHVQHFWKLLHGLGIPYACRFAAPYFPMTHLNAHVSGDRVAAAYQRSVLRSQERLG